jgi:hypothetical protein
MGDFEYSIENFWWPNIPMAVLLGFVFRALAFWVLVSCNPAAQGRQKDVARSHRKKIRRATKESRISIAAQ